MDVQPYQTPPRWWSPQLTPRRFRFWRFIRRRMRVKYHHLLEIEVQGMENLQKCLDQRSGIMITPNHSCHADPSVLYWVADQLGIPFYFMAASQIFMRANWFRLLVLRHHGCFSVDREGTDIRAFRQAVEILRNKPHPLVIFPEGEIYHINKRVTPFLDGPSAIALNACKHAKRPICFVPCGIRYHYIDNPMEELARTHGSTGGTILWRPKRNLILRKRIYQFAEAILGLKEMEYLGNTQTGTLPERIQALAEYHSPTSGKPVWHHGPMPPPSRNGSRPAGAKPFRTSENDNLSDARNTMAAKIDLDDLFIMTQLFSYPGNLYFRKTNH